MGDSIADNMVLFIKFIGSSFQTPQSPSSINKKEFSLSSTMSPTPGELMPMKVDELTNMVIQDGYCSKIDRARKAIKCCHGDLIKTYHILGQISKIENSFH